MAAFLDDRWYENRKWELLEERGARTWADCFAVWGAANAYCKANRTGGEITLKRLEKITPLKRSRLKTIAFELCSVELFDQTGHETWSFRNWNEWNKHENDPETTRKKNRDRQRRHREKKQENTECNGVTARDSHADVTARDTGPVPPYQSYRTDPTPPYPPQGAGAQGEDFFEPPLGERMATRFRAAWLSARQVDPSMGGKSLAGFPARVEATAEAQGVEPMQLFERCLAAFLAGEIDDVARRAPYAVFSARFGELADGGPSDPQDEARFAASQADERIRAAKEAYAEEQRIQRQRAASRPPSDLEPIGDALAWLGVKNA